MTKKVYTLNEIKKKIGKILSNFPVEKAILFGSYANGSANNRSDIDLVVKFPEEFNVLDFLEVLELLTIKTKKDIDLIEERDIIRGGKIYNEVTNTGVIIYER